MVLTVTLNPLLERRLIYNQVALGTGNRASNEFYYSGGKGINVSKQLNHLGMKNHALTFLGGNNGKILRHCLTDDKIEFTVISTKSETRLADVIIENDNNRVSTFFGLNSVITHEEAEEFKSKLDKMIQNCSCVVFAGSSPCAATDDIFPFGIRLAHKYDKTSILDTYGNHLEVCLKEAPTVIHNNVHEIDTSLGIKLNSEEDKFAFLNHLYKKGIKLSFLTDEANPTYASKFDYSYKIESPTIFTKDSTGSGDAFVAGVVYGLEHSLVFEEFVKLAAALGTANAATLDTCNITKTDYEKYLNEIIISPIGKKMKLIDDSPKY